MSINNDQHIKNEASKIRVNPSEGAWKKLDSKLKSSKMNSRRQKVRVFRFIGSIAAFGLILFASVIVFTTDKKSQIKGHIAEWESLDHSEDYFYSSAQIRDLYIAYSK